MATLSTMKSRIADELARSDLTSQIAAAITSAIAFYEGRRFWWNETTANLTTSASQEWYSSADFADMPYIAEFDSVRLTVSGRPYPLIRRTYEEIEWLSAGTATNGDPTDYVYYAQQLRLYPVPNQARVLSLSYVKKLTALSSDSDTNAWTTEAEELIRTHAKVDLLENIIRSADAFQEADRLRRREAEILGRLDQETAQRVSSRGIVPSYL